MASIVKGRGAVRLARSYILTSPWAANLLVSSGGSGGGGANAVNTLAIGMNTNFSGYGYNQHTFHDLVIGQGISYWDTTLNSGAGGWVSEVPAAYLDANGWPTAMPPNASYFAVVLMAPDTAGPYKVTWDDPNAKAGFVAISTVSGTPTQSGNSITFTANPQPINIGPMLKWSINAGGGYPSNFQCRLVTDDGSVLAPNFKARAQALCQNGGPWRVMHQTSVEANRGTNPGGNWSAKYPVDGDGQLLDPIFTSTTRNTGPLNRLDGLSLENLVALGTNLNRPVQWSAPWNCDSTYLSTAASKWAAFAVATGSKVYVARSNECWNRLYHVASQCQNEADYHATQFYSKTAVRLVATSNITLSGTPTIDGVTPAAGDRVLCAGQATASQNGVYVVAAGAWSRAADTIASGDEWFVSDGTATSSNGYRQTSWKVRTTGAITIGTTALSITRFQTWERYAEKAKELFDAFVSAFTSAGVIDKLECVLEWQNSNGSTSAWDAMRAIATNASALSVAPYVGVNGSTGEMQTAGYGTSYVGAIAPIWPSAKASCDTILGQFKIHNDYAVANGLKMVVYEMGPQIGFTDVTTFTNFIHDAGNYDYVQYLLQEVEKINPNLSGSLFQLVQSVQNSNGGAYQPQTTYWGFLEGTYQAIGSNTPKYNAVVDFYGGKRSPQDLTGTIAYAPNPVNGQQAGSLKRRVKGSTLTFQSGGAGLAIDNSTGIVTVADSTLAPTSSGSVTVRETHPGFPAPGYHDTVVPLTVAVTLNPTTGVNKSAGINLSNGNLTAQCANTSGNFVRAIAGPAATKFQMELIVGAGGCEGLMFGLDDGTQDYSVTGVYPGSTNSKGWAVELRSGGIVNLYYGGSGTPKVAFNNGAAFFVAGDVLTVKVDTVARTLTLYRNGTVIPNFNGITVATALSAYNAFCGSWATNPMTVNLGGSAFTHPLDSGYVGYQG